MRYFILQFFEATYLLIGTSYRLNKHIIVIVLISRLIFIHKINKFKTFKDLLTLIFFIFSGSFHNYKKYTFFKEHIPIGVHYSYKKTDL